MNGSPMKMFAGAVTCALLALALLAPPRAAHAQNTIVYGYLPYWEYRPAEAPWEQLTHIAIFSVGIDSSGNILQEDRWHGRAEEAVALGAEHDVKVHLCVTNFDDSSQFALLSDPARRALAVERLAGLVNAYGADGINVDFEGVGEQSRDLMVTFVEELKAEVDEVFLAAPFVDWRDAWDYGALTDASDGLFIMAYEAHGSWGDAGPNVPLFESGRWGFISLEWTVNDYFSGGADLQKVIVGLPTYGHAWTVADPTAVPTATTDHDRVLWYRDNEVARFGRRFDDDSASTYFAQDGSIQGWVDDAAALLAKLEWVVNESGTGGVGFWALGYDDNDPLVWDYLASLNADEPDPPAADTFAGELLGVSQTGLITLEEGDAVQLWVDVENVGSETWSTSTTRLAPVPRDAGSPLEYDDWLSSSRIVGVDGATATGEVGRFEFVVRVPSAGQYELRLGLVEEGVAWFADVGGPDDGFVSFEFEVAIGEPTSDVGVPDAGTPDAGNTDAGNTDTGSNSDTESPDMAVEDSSGSSPDSALPSAYGSNIDGAVTVRGCAAGRGGWSAFTLLALLLTGKGRRRQRQASRRFEGEGVSADRI